MTVVKKNKRKSHASVSESAESSEPAVKQPKIDAKSQTVAPDVNGSSPGDKKKGKSRRRRTSKAKSHGAPLTETVALSADLTTSTQMGVKTVTSSATTNSPGKTQNVKSANGVGSQQAEKSKKKKKHLKKPRSEDELREIKENAKIADRKKEERIFLYLKSWKDTHPNKFKFHKGLQTWMCNNVCNVNRFPDDKFAIAIEYFQSTPIAVHQYVLDKANKLINSSSEKQVDSKALERAKEVVKMFESVGVKVK